MLWSTNTAWANRKALRHFRSGLIIAFCLVGFCYAQVSDLRVPANLSAGASASIGTTGSGSATFYLAGPSVAIKRDVKLGEEVSLSAKELQSAGKYVAIVCADSCRSAEFFVSPAKPVSLSFLVHPSRAPVGLNDVISGVAIAFDESRNLVLAPPAINFQLTANGATLMSRSVVAHDGAAWFRTNSGKSAGRLQLTASIHGLSDHDLSVQRVVQQVASDPCNLRIKGQRNAKGIAVETELVRDCAGNPVPDGTVVTFTATGSNQKSTVDAPIKQGIARAQITETGAAVISAASGVVMGNEVRLGAQ
jgi:hypothetical protein